MTMPFKTRPTAALWLTIAAGLFAPGRAECKSRALDVQRSEIIVRVYKSGLLSAFAHNHQIIAPIERGTIDVSEPPAVELWVETARLRVVDAGVSQDERTKIQETMLGSAVLDSSRFLRIHFRSSRVSKVGERRWNVQGDLDLHGQTARIAMTVERRRGSYLGSVSLKQTEFGIKPVRIAAGAVRVKDSVTVEFEIVPAQ